MKTHEVSQGLLIREMSSHEIVEYATKLNTNSKDYQMLIRKCIDCYKQLTGKNLLNELNELSKQDA